MPTGNLPLVSICIPTYNAGEFFEDALQSALAQTHTHTEIVICDDGSTDNTVEIVEKYQKQHAHIRLIKNEHNLGMVNNWNKCIEESKGEWIKFLFQDDLLQKDCVQKMLDGCNHYNAVVGLCARDFIISENASPQL
jgi:glycosyltransferase involved in cell wall biosynthesis